MTEDTVNHPHHYEGVPCECILLAEQYSFNIGSMIKYVWRHDRKGHAKTLLLLKADFTTDETEKPFWQGLADGNASAVNTALQTMIDKAER